MSYSEHFEYFYKGLKRKDYSVIYNMIQDYLWESYDEEREKIIDTTKFKSAYKLCTSVYNDLKEYENQIEEDLKEINGEYGTPMFSYADIPGIQDMNYICKIYHKFFEYADLSILPDDNKINETPPKTVKSKPEIVFNKDHNPNHKEWFIKILSSKIPEKQSDKDTFILKCLNSLFDELCKMGCLDPDDENRDIFIYRFSGFNEIYPPDIKIRWKGKNLFLGYIARCLLSDKINEPEGLGIISSVFLSESEKKINLATAKNYMVNNFEEEKRKKALPLVFIKAVELLRKCGFVNVEFTSSRR